MPPAAKLALIVVPVVALVAVIGYKLSLQQAEPDVVVVNPNTEIDALKAEVPKLQRLYQEVSGMLRKDSGGDAKIRAESLQETLDDWSLRWNAIFDAKRNEDGDLPEELEGYGQDPDLSRVMQMRNDLMRLSGF